MSFKALVPGVMALAESRGGQGGETNPGRLIINGDEDDEVTSEVNSFTTINIVMLSYSCR